MKITIPKESSSVETRVPFLPVHVTKLVQNGGEVLVEKGLGSSCWIEDKEYELAGASIVSDRNTLLEHGDVIIRLGKPSLQEAELVKSGALHVSMMDPFNSKELINLFCDNGVSSISLEMIPRSTIAQKMDVLSSQASLAGYVAVITAAQKLNKIFPMMMTPAGTISPTRIFIVGAGVAGLQAVATAKRLGAVVEAYDTRPEVAEQVKSLGGKFVHIDIGETKQTKDGYARPLTREQLEKQRKEISKHCALADVVITTALVFGKKAPLIISKDMMTGMKPGSLVIDMAVESGGNVEGSVPDQEIDINGVTLIGVKNMPGKVAFHASQMVSSNLYSFVSHYWNQEIKKVILDVNDEILKGCLITHEKKIVNQQVRDILE